MAVKGVDSLVVGASKEEIGLQDYKFEEEEREASG